MPVACRSTFWLRMVAVVDLRAMKLTLDARPVCSDQDARCQETRPD